MLRPLCGMRLAFTGEVDGEGRLAVTRHQPGEGGEARIRTFCRVSSRSTQGVDRWAVNGLDFISMNTQKTKNKYPAQRESEPSCNSPRRSH